MSRLRLLLVVLATGGSFSPQARAFCRTTTCDPADASQRCTRDSTTRCVTSGKPLYWASGCLTISVQGDGAPRAGIDYAAAKTSVERAFAAWTGVDCHDERPSLRVVVSGPVACDVSEYSSNRRNANIVMFREWEWPYVGAEDALGLTRLRFDTDTGELFDADIEVNAVTEPLSAGEPGPREVDLDSLLTHEAGHALGLAHTLDDDASMQAGYTPGSIELRTLADDDVAGLCFIYPPGRETRGTSCEPRHGFSALCAKDQPDESEPDPGSDVEAVDAATNSGCRVAVAPKETFPVSAATLLLAGGWLVVRSKRRRPRHTRVTRSFLAQRTRRGDKPDRRC